MNRLTSATAKNRYAPHLSCQRLRNVQSLLLDKDVGCDSILCVLGVDSKFNEGCRELANYLTLGFFSQLKALEEAGVEEDDSEDVIILVRSNSAAVYCGASLYPHLLPYVAHWRNVQIYSKSPPRGKYDRDTDSEERYKVKCFISMVKNCKTVGVPYLGSSFSKSTKNVPIPAKPEFSIEAWPLIQSFQEDGIGTGVSFQSEHKTIDIRNKIAPFYNQCSPFVLGKIVKNSYPLFKRHWDEALTIVSNAMKNKDTPQLTEKQVTEPLLCYFKHGNLMKLSQKGAVIEESRKPCALFGTHTAEFGKASQPLDLTSAAKKNAKMAVHMILQCVSPNEPLLCTRTYFFRPDGANESAMKDYNNLVHLYTVCTEGCDLAIDEFVSSCSIAEAESKGAGHILSKGLSCGLVFDAKCTITGYDKMGKRVQLEEGNLSPHTYNIKLGVENIKTSHGGETLGSVMFSETFVVSSFEVRDYDAAVCKDNVCSLLTSDVPVYMEWRIGATQHAHSEDEPLAVLKDVTVCSGSSLYSPPCYINFQVGQNGNITLSSRVMDDIVLKGGVQYFDSPDPGEVCIITVNFDLPDNAQHWGLVPPNFRGEVSLIADMALTQASKCLVLGLIPGTQAYKEFYAVVVHHLQHDTDTDIAVKKAKTVSNDVMSNYKALQDAHKYRRAILKSTFSKRESSVKRHSYDQFLDHFTLSTVSRGYVVPCDVTSVILRMTNPIKSVKDEQPISVTIISGHPSSGCDDVGQQIVDLNKERVRWVVIRPKLASDGTVNRDLIEEQLSQAVQNKRVSRPSAAARKKLRILIVATGFFDLCEIVQCVNCHSDRTVCEQISIGAITVCINPKSVHMVERQNYPKYFDQCLQGIANNFAFVVEDKEITGALDKSLADAQSLVRHVNKQAAFIICPGAKLMRKNDFDMVLAEDSFSQSKCVAERFLLRPELHTGKYQASPSTPSISRVKLEFTQPLLRGSFSARLRGLKSTISAPQSIGSVCFVSGCVAFTDDPKQEYDTSFSSATKEVELVPHAFVQNQPAPPSKSSPRRAKPYHLDFYGIDLEEQALRDWLRKCGRQKPSKKSHKTKNRLTKTEIQRIHEGNCTRNLPDGYFYNGSFYVNLFDNKKSLHHPYMAKFVDEYLADENEEIDTYNADVDRQNIKDVFE